MSGILNSKTRIFDTILTQEGRRQMASGKLRAEFYSFSDAEIFYNDDTVTGSYYDATRRIALEAASLPQDQITFEADDSGRLVSVRGSEVQLSNGKIITFLTGVQGSVRNEVVEIEDSQFASLAQELLSSSLNNFSKLQIIGSPDIFDENRNEFIVSKEQLNFTITNNRPLSDKQIQTISVDHAESLFQDKRLSHVPNFHYLPPVNKANPGSQLHSPLGYYAKLGQRPYFEFEDVERELDYLKKTGYEEVVEFTETSRTNNLVCQFFELSNEEIIKLDVIDFGLFYPPQKTNLTDDEFNQLEKEGRNLSTESSSKHIFFVGKLFKDSNNSHTFVNMFIIVFE